jgi:hypothetical protein
MFALFSCANMTKEPRTNFTKQYTSCTEVIVLDFLDSQTGIFP